jgi:hypothetical protein
VILANRLLWFHDGLRGTPVSFLTVGVIKSQLFVCIEVLIIRVSGVDTMTLHLSAFLPFGV